MHVFYSGKSYFFLKVKNLRFFKCYFFPVNIISIISLSNGTFSQNILPILFYICQNKQQSFLKRKHWELMSIYITGGLVRCCLFVISFILWVVLARYHRELSWIERSHFTVKNRIIYWRDWHAVFITGQSRVLVTDPLFLLPSSSVPINCLMVCPNHIYNTPMHMATLLFARAKKIDCWQKKRGTLALHPPT